MSGREETRALWGYRLHRTTTVPSGAVARTSASNSPDPAALTSRPRLPHPTSGTKSLIEPSAQRQLRGAVRSRTSGAAHASRQEEPPSRSHSLLPVSHRAGCYVRVARWSCAPAARAELS